MEAAPPLRSEEVSTLAPGLHGPRCVPDIAVEERDGAFILLHPERASYLVTNEAGLRAYRLADGTRTPAEILEDLSRQIEPHLRRFYAGTLPPDAVPHTQYNART